MQQALVVMEDGSGKKKNPFNIRSFVADNAVLDRAVERAKGKLVSEAECLYLINILKKHRDEAPI